MKEWIYSSFCKIVHRALILIVIKLNYVVYPHQAENGKDEEECDTETIYGKLHCYLVEEKHFLDKNIQLKQVAYRIGVEKVVLNKILREKYDLTLHAYINKLRIEHACILLKAPDDKLIEVIAAECSFNTTRTFDRNFKKSYNMTPSEYRNMGRFAEKASRF